MEELQAIVYVSAATRRMSEAALTALLVDARDFNARLGVTGALLYSDGDFLQYFEGPRPALALVYARIQAARTHHGLIKLLDQAIPARRFESWHMGFAQPPRSLFLRLAQARWVEVANRQGRPDAHPDGVAVLMDFWHGHLKPGQA